MSANAIRLSDAEGRLIAAGCEWSEPKDLITAAGLACGLAGATALGLAMSAFGTNVPLGAGLLCVSGLVTRVAWSLIDDRFQRRSLVFGLAGTMRMPHGVPGYFFRRLIEGHHAQIATMEKIRDEAMPDGKPSVTHRVAIYGKEGHIVRVTGALHPDLAHMVAVQLNAALQAVRDELSWQARARFQGGVECR